MTAEVSSQATRGKYHSIGKYEIVSHIATGGMGVIYRAVDGETGRDVALKILAPTLATNPVALERFRREARQGVKLRHENLVSIYELGEANDIYFLAQEFVEGIDLHEYITEQGYLQPDEARDLLTQGARALDYLHRQQVVHRDIKPANFLLTHVGDRIVLKLTDLGLAREVKHQDFRVTQAGNTVGTIDYMAPEQARDSSFADIRSDIYSLGCTFYHMLAGQPPFPEGGLTERLYKHIEAEPTDVRDFNPEIPFGLTKILKRMLAKKPIDRYQTPAEILDDLRRLEGSPHDPELNAVATLEEESLRLKEDALPTPKRKSAASGDWADAPTQFSIQAYPDAPVSEPALARSTPARIARPVNPEHARIAASQFIHAQQGIGTGNFDYAVHLLKSCCRLDPGNLIYRQALRCVEAKQIERGANRRRWFGWFKDLGAKARMKTALKARDPLKVLEYGEELLAEHPRDIGIQLDMAEAADRLGYAHVALWMLEHAWTKKTHTPPLNRALARLYEKYGMYVQAVALWKLVLKKNPSDHEAYNKANDLAARETIVRGRYKEMVESRAADAAQ
jgi:serine/threonine-protein kinase